MSRKPYLSKPMNKQDLVKKDRDRSQELFRAGNEPAKIAARLGRPLSSILRWIEPCGRITAPGSRRWVV